MTTASPGLESLVTTDMPSGILPMALTPNGKPFTSGEFQFEIKWDGFRIVAYCKGEDVSLRSRNDKDFNSRFAGIRSELAALNLDAVFDGEVVALKEDGCADFTALMEGSTDCLVYYVFDLLYYEGVNMMNKPLTFRRELLEHILPNNFFIRFSDHLDDEGEKLFEAAEKLGIEGIVAKRKNSSYQPGIRTRDWIKIKAYQTSEAYIAGALMEKIGNHSKFVALVIGIDERFIGLVSHGVTTQAKSVLFQNITTRCCFKSEPDVNKRTSFREPIHNPQVIWTKPIPCRVKYLELDGNGFMRHQSFAGLLG